MSDLVKSTSPFPRHIPSLDGLRGMAVLAVFAVHLSPYVKSMGEAFHKVAIIAEFGWAGVDLFFVLSGFLITGILYDHRQGRNRLRAFYGRRLLRIAPLYYLFLFIYAALAPVIGTIGHASALYDALPWHALYLTNIRVALAESWSAAPMYTSHFWSLAVEEQFYLLWPGLMAAALRFSRSPRQTMMWMCGAFVLLSIAFRLWILPHSAIGAYALLPARIDALSVGAFMALWTRGPKGVRHPLVWSKYALPLCVLVLGLLAFFSAGTRSYLHPLQQSLGYTVWALLFVCILIQAAAQPKGWLARLLTLRPLTTTGRISYALYLLHLPVIFVLERAGMHHLGPLPFCVAVLTVSYGLAFLSWHYLEAPLLQFKQRFAYDATPVQTNLIHSQGQPKKDTVAEASS